MKEEEMPYRNFLRAGFKDVQKKREEEYGKKVEPRLYLGQKGRLQGEEGGATAMIIRDDAEDENKRDDQEGGGLFEAGTVANRIPLREISNRGEAKMGALGWVAGEGERGWGKTGKENRGGEQRFLKGAEGRQDTRGGLKGKAEERWSSQTVTSEEREKSDTMERLRRRDEEVKEENKRQERGEGPVQNGREEGRRMGNRGENIGAEGEVTMEEDEEEKKDKDTQDRMGQKDQKRRWKRRARAEQRAELEGELSQMDEGNLIKRQRGEEIGDGEQKEVKGKRRRMDGEEKEENSDRNAEAEFDTQPRKE